MNDAAVQGALLGGGGNGGDSSRKPNNQGSSGKAGRRNVVVERICAACAFTGASTTAGSLNHAAHA